MGGQSNAFDKSISIAPIYLIASRAFSSLQRFWEELIDSHTRIEMLPEKD